MKLLKKLLLFFLLLIFISGIAFCLNPQITRDTFVETLRDETPLERVSEPNTNTCHDLLIRLGNELNMFNTRLPKSDTNPIVFQNLDE